MTYTDKQYLQSLTKNQQLSIMKVDFFNDNKLKIIEKENAYVLPPIFGSEDTAWFIGGVLDNDKKYIDESGQYAYGETNRVYGDYKFDINDVENIDEEVIYFNFYLSQWGHYLLDVIGRLWYIINNTDKRIVYTTDLNGNNHIKGNFLQLLSIFGIKEDRLIFVNKVTKFKKVIIPDTSILVAKYYTKEYKQIIDILVENALKGYILKTDRKVYCSRRMFSSANNKELGEEKIELLFKENGYEIVYMEKLNLVEQIRLLNECKEIACISGTLAHNAMFIRNKQCNFTILNKTYKINPNIYLTNELSDAKITFVDSYLSPLPISIGKGPFIITITNELFDYCKDKELNIKNYKTKIDLSLILKYYKYYLIKYRKRILNNRKISNSGFKEYDVSNEEIKKHYKKQLKLLNK